MKRDRQKEVLRAEFGDPNDLLEVDDSHSYGTLEKYLSDGCTEPFVVKYVKMEAVRLLSSLQSTKTKGICLKALATLQNNHSLACQVFIAMDYLEYKPVSITDLCNKIGRYTLFHPAPDFWGTCTDFYNPPNLPPQVQIHWDGVEPCTVVNIPRRISVDEMINHWTTFFRPRMYHPVFFEAIRAHMVTLFKEFFKRSLPQGDDWVVCHFDWNELLRCRFGMPAPKSILSHFFLSGFCGYKRILNERGKVSNMNTVLEVFAEMSKDKLEGLLERRYRLERETYVATQRNGALLEGWLNAQGFCNWRECAKLLKDKAHVVTTWVTSHKLGIAQTDKEWELLSAVLEDPFLWKDNPILMHAIFPRERYLEEMKLYGHL